MAGSEAAGLISGCGCATGACLAFDFSRSVRFEASCSDWAFSCILRMALSSISLALATAASQLAGWNVLTDSEVAGLISDCGCSTGACPALRAFSAAIYSAAFLARSARSAAIRRSISRSRSAFAFARLAFSAAIYSAADIGRFSVCSMATGFGSIRGCSSSILGRSASTLARSEAMRSASILACSARSASNFARSAASFSRWTASFARNSFRIRSFRS